MSDFNEQMNLDLSLNMEGLICVEQLYMELIVAVRVVKQEMVSPKLGTILILPCFAYGSKNEKRAKKKCPY